MDGQTLFNMTFPANAEGPVCQMDGSLMTKVAGWKDVLRYGCMNRMYRI